MPYPVNRTDGTLVANIQDYTRDTSTSLTLLGRGAVDYGEAIAENFIHLLENFASPTPPPNPLEGQIWFHTFEPATDGQGFTVVNKAKIWNGTTWAEVGGTAKSIEPPSNPEPGDLWYDMESNRIYYWDGQKWKPVGGPYTGDHVDDSDLPSDPEWGTLYPPPPNPAEGDLWWMIPERQLYGYDESLAATSPWPPTAKRVDGSPVPNGWALIGPLGDKTDESFIDIGKMVDEDGNEIMGIKIIVDGELVAVWTNQTFSFEGQTLDGYEFLSYTSDVDNPDGISMLSKGLTMNHKLGMKLQGIAADAERLDGLDSTAFLRADEHTGPEPGAMNMLKLGSPESHWAEFYATDILAGTSTIENADTSRVNIWGKAYSSERTDFAEKAEMFSAGKNLTASGDVEWSLLDFAGTAANDYAITTALSAAAEAKIREWAMEEAEDLVGSAPSGAFVPLDNSSVPTGAHDMGSTGSRWGTIFAQVFDGVATQARYADLAERYEADAAYPVGTLLSIGGDKEVTITKDALDEDFFGVVSKDPAFLMNSEAGSDETHPAVALEGRVPVRVVGTVRKGQRLVLSDIPGVAVGFTGNLISVNPFLIVGRALEDKPSEEEGLVLAVVGKK